MAGRKKQDANTDGNTGYTSSGGPEFLPIGSLGRWAHGVMPAHRPGRVGRVMKKGSDLVLQVHRNPDGVARSDQSSVGLYFAKRLVTGYAEAFPKMQQKIDSPAGEKNHTIDIDLTLPMNVEILGVIPHMHLVGTRWNVWATLSGGEKLYLVDIRRWDFRWQDHDRFQSPPQQARGTKIRATVSYDNSSGNPKNSSDSAERVRNGKHTTDEMCIVPLAPTTGDARKVPRRRR